MGKLKDKPVKMSQAKRIPIDDVEELEFCINNIKKLPIKEFISKFITYFIEFYDFLTFII